MAEQTVKDLELTITPAARESLLGVRAQDPDPDRLVLRVSVTGVTDGSYDHEMSFELTTDLAGSDLRVDLDGLPVAVPGESAPKLQGATIDVDPAGGGWAIHNPNRPRLRERRPLDVVPGGGHRPPPSSPAVGTEAPEELRASLQGDLAQRVATVLERHINPNIASHGGHAELVGIKEAQAHLRLSGGCQGCSMAAVTLRQGIEQALRELVPEIRGIVDVTDHESGENPYYSEAHAH